MKKLLVIILTFALAYHYGYTQNEITNIKWTDTNGKINVYYDLNAPSNEEYHLDLMLYDNHDNKIHAFTLTGDYPVVQGGGQKNITWEYVKDMDINPNLDKVVISIDKVIKKPINVLIKTAPTRAEIILDSTNIGISPQTITLDVGEHFINVEETVNYKAYASTILIVPDKTNYTINLDKKEDNLKITTFPNFATIYLNQKHIGTSPIATNSYYTKNKIRATKTGYVPRKKTVYLNNSPKNINIKLKPRTKMGVGIGLDEYISLEAFINIGRLGFIGSLLVTDDQLIYKTGYTGQLSFRVLYPIEFTINGGIGVRIPDEEVLNEYESVSTPVIGATLPLNLSNDRGFYVKGEYWLPSDLNEMFLFSFGYYLTGN